MSDPYSRLREARKQIRLVTEDLEDVDQDVVEDLEEAARLVEAAQDELAASEDDSVTGG